VLKIDNNVFAKSLNSIKLSLDLCASINRRSNFKEDTKRIAKIQETKSIYSLCIFESIKDALATREKATFNVVVATISNFKTLLT